MSASGGVGISDVRRVRVGSLNPPKLAGVEAAFHALAPGARVEPVDVESGVPEQPLGWTEVKAGARNRAEAALRSGPCDLGVGYEDGLVQMHDDDTWFNVGCAAVSDGQRLSVGLSSGFAYPPACVASAVSDRAPIGDVFDRFWREQRDVSPAGASALSVGNVGKLSQGVLPRAEYTRHAVVCALFAFLHPDLYRAQPDLYSAPGAVT